MKRREFIKLGVAAAIIGAPTTKIFSPKKQSKKEKQKQQLPKLKVKPFKKFDLYKKHDLAG